MSNKPDLHAIANMARTAFQDHKTYAESMHDAAKMLDAFADWLEWRNADTMPSPSSDASVQVDATGAPHFPRVSQSESHSRTIVQLARVTDFASNDSADRFKRRVSELFESAFAAGLRAATMHTCPTPPKSSQE